MARKPKNNTQEDKKMDCKYTSEEDRHYISLLQENIQRMSSNSANCKIWILGINSALIAIVSQNIELINLLWFSVLFDILFCCLDAYYLSIEKKFRKIESDYVSSLKIKGDLYKFIKGKAKKCAFCSLSIWPFYLVLISATIVFILCSDFIWGYQCSCIYCK